MLASSPKNPHLHHRADWNDPAKRLSYKQDERSSDLVDLLTLSDELAGAPDIPTLLRRTVEIARDRIGLERVGIYLLDPTGQILQGFWGTDLHGRTTDERQYAFAKGDSEETAFQLVQSGKSRWLVIDNSPLMIMENGISRQVRQGWLTITPLRSARDILGVLFNDTALTGTPLDAWKQERAAILCAIVSQLLERKRSEEVLLQKSMYDDPSGLPTQALFLDRLQRRALQLENESRYAVVAISLDRWTTISESYSPHFYEAFLALVAQRLTQCLETGDTASRLSTNEFAVLIDSVENAQHAETIVLRLLDSLSRPMLVEGEEIHTTASAGLALDNDEDPFTPEEHLQNARAALARAKTSGNANTAHFRHSDRDLLLTNYRLENELHKAVEQGDFVVHYQPVVNLMDSELHGFEALIRWIHPQRGLIQPGMFIPMAEENGLIRAIGEWILSETCRQANVWRKSYGSRASGVTLAVNLSVRQFNQPDLVERVQRILDQSGMPPRLLHLEITESAVMEDPEQARSVLARLKSLGVFLSLDDFGTGFSSLSYLTRLPLDSLKIDRSFVMRLGQDARTEAVVRALCDLARDLGMEVIAEGVETPLQLEALRSFHCHYIQGFLVSRPLNSEEAGHLLDEGTKPSASEANQRLTRRMPILTANTPLL